MKIEIDRQKKMVEIWLTNQEQQNAAVMESLADYYRQYQAEKYRVAVFFSGKRELRGLTEELLLHNRRVAAKAELAREELAREENQQIGMTMSM